MNNQHEPVPAPQEGRDFLQSVLAFSARNLQSAEELQAARRRGKRLRARRLLMQSVCVALCIALLGYSVWMMAARILEDHASEAGYEAFRPHPGSVVKRPATLREPGALPTVEGADGRRGISGLCRRSRL